METTIPPTETKQVENKSVEPVFDVLESIRQHVAQLKPYVPERGLIIIGEYPTKITLKEPFVEKLTGVMPILVQKAEGEDAKPSPLSQKINPENILNVAADVDAHFWFNIDNYFASNEEMASRLAKVTEKLHEATIFASVWEGIGSATLSALLAQFKKSNARSVALAITPSRSQPSDAQFNALAAIGASAVYESAAIVLVGRDFAEDYIGIDRKGTRMKGNTVVNYMLQLMLEKDTLTLELSELSRAFNVKLYSGISIMGASYKVYGSFESMLDAAQLNPFLPFDIATASVIYVLTRVPLSLKDKLARGQIELATAEWAKRIANVKSIYVGEPIYVNDAHDRVDIVLFIGGLNMTDLSAFLQKKSDKVRSEMIKKGLIKEKEWETLVKSLTGSH